MYFLGCLSVMLIAVAMMAIVVVGRSLELVGATVVWLWESLLNLFRPEGQKKVVHNPWQPRERQYSSPWEGYGQTTDGGTFARESTAEAPEATPRPKVFDKDDGEYIDFVEIH